MQKIAKTVDKKKKILYNGGENYGRKRIGRVR